MISATAGASSPNTFNPAIGVVLVARYANVDSGWDQIPGFVPGGELGPGSSGVSLGESELNMNASVDSRFFGNLTLALEDDDGDTSVAVEEAWVQTTALPHGLTLLGDRYFFGVGITGYVSGLLLSTRLDLPAGAVIVWCGAASTSL